MLALFLLAATVVLGISVPMVFVGLVILAAGLGTLIRPEIGLHVLVVNALIGLNHLVELPRLGPLSTPIMIEGLVLGAILFQVAFMGMRLRFGTAQHALMGLLAGWILLSVMTGVFVGPENFRQYRSLFLVRLVMFLLVTALMASEAAIKRLVVTLIVSNVGLLAVSTAVRLGYFGQERITVSQNFERTGALIQNPNELAFGLTTMLVLSIISFLYVKRASIKVFLLCLAAADLFAVMSTLSRSGFISLCIVLLFLFFKLTRNVRAIGVILILVLCGWLMMPEALFERFSRIDEIKDVDRFQVARVGLAMAAEHPLLGVGLGNYVPLFWDYNVSALRREYPSHNMYLDLAAQMGLPSLALYLACFGLAWRQLRRMERRLRAEGRTRGFHYLLGLAIQAFFVNLAVFGLSGDVEFDYGAFIFLGLSIALVRDEALRSSSRRRSDTG